MEMRNKGRLIIISNRLPLSIKKSGKEYTIEQNVGGLATGLGSFYKDYNALWIGWADVPAQDREGVRRKMEREFNCYPIFISEKLSERYYEGFANKTLWPLFHSLHMHSSYSSSYWKAYERVNKIFAQRVAALAKPDDIIWINDYHHMVLPKYIKQKLPDARIGFFLHTPFPTYDLVTMLPWYKELLEASLYSDLIGFHTYGYASAFLESVRVLLGYDNYAGRIILNDRVIKVGAFPMGIDYRKFRSASNKPKVRSEIRRIRKSVGPKTLIFSISRLDYTKGILRQLSSFKKFLSENPQLRHKAVYALTVVPSRENLKLYRMLKRSIDEMVGKINSRYGVRGWIPIWYTYGKLSFSRLVAFYKIADIMLTLPIKDGMNLVAKEFLAVKGGGKGLLILSQTAGAAKELFEAAVVNPNDEDEVVRRIREYMTTKGKGTAIANKNMMRKIEELSIRRWAERFIEDLETSIRLSNVMAPRVLDSSSEGTMLSKYRNSRKRLFIFDYDGTLIPIHRDYAYAKRSAPVIGALKKLVGVDGNSVFVVSGRSRKSLDRIFKDVNVSLVAEHGAWFKPHDATAWESTVPIDDKWKAEIMPILRIYAERLKGSAIEQKDVSLTWHYRAAKSPNASDVALELGNILTNLTANSNLKVVYGKKSIEVMNTYVSKGMSYLKLMSNTKHDFILAIGDDSSDESIFEVLPKGSFSIKVGMSVSNAKYNLKSQRDVVRLLRKILSETKQPGAEADAA
ncbi:MAG: bifunctional alpha,alpha-trehalose-phosphate synthase (UDP-forming)/trehalose-phosphatase [Candidatus Micrarchaeota archaeon]|nr:bifunctional alpha,alpha-trehalose-phosphate synthase (UDP-forming)/trehalose-phosphatase [Candidatus Micrarchaeota archaeon]